MFINATDVNNSSTISADIFVYCAMLAGSVNAVCRHDSNKGKVEIGLDLRGEYSHEYYPKLSIDENDMVLGTSAGGHEHGSADYEIFLWQPGSSTGSAERLVFHTVNDNWPDVYINLKVVQAPLTRHDKS